LTKGKPGRKKKGKRKEGKTTFPSKRDRPEGGKKAPMELNCTVRKVPEADSY